MLALRGLDAARKADLPIRLDEGSLRADLEADLQEFHRRRDQMVLLGNDHSPELRLLVRAVDEAAALARERVFRRLALIYPAREMLRAHRGIASGDDRIRAFALEYLEATLSPEDRERLLPALREPIVEAAVSRQTLVETLAGDEDIWIATLAVHVLGVWRAASLRRLVADPMRQDAVYQEAARWALARL
jgi:hypothetical protein